MTPVPEETTYFHTQLRWVNPLLFAQVYTILDREKGQGQYVCTYMIWGNYCFEWWGEGGIKFYFDNDREFSTIGSIGAEDYFCGSYNFDPSIPNFVPEKDRTSYTEFITPYTGLPKVIRPDGKYQTQVGFGLYRWHILDPIRFKREWRVTFQVLEWCRDYRYLPLQDNIAYVAYWHQALPASRFPTLPGKDELEII